MERPERQLGRRSRRERIVFHLEVKDLASLALSRAVGRRLFAREKKWSALDSDDSSGIVQVSARREYGGEENEKKKFEF